MPVKKYATLKAQVMFVVSAQVYSSLPYVHILIGCGFYLVG